ncbi:phosphoribosylaminoimidazole carboxylase, partial [Lacticaseibacillus rhamnosus]
VAVMVAKADKEIRIGPVIQNYFEHHQLKASSVRADVDPAVIVEIRRIAEKIAKKLDYNGIFSLEFFLAVNGTLYVKRVFPGPKLYGHLMQCTSDISEYELHLRAILGWPLPELELAEDGVAIPLRQKDMDAVLTQIQIKPDWRFAFYPTGNELVGEIEIVGDLKAIKDSINATGHFVIQ